MRTDSDGLYGQKRASSAISPTSAVTATLNGEVLMTLPVLSGQISDDEAMTTRGQLKFSVPLLPELLPVGDSAPLGNNGQQITVVKSINGSSVTLGIWTITYAQSQSGLINVVAGGPLAALGQAKITADAIFDGTLRGAINALTANILTVHVDPALVDAALTEPAEWKRGDDRLQRFYEILDAWPAEVTITNGQVTIRPPYDDDNPGAPVETYADGVAAASLGIPGTLIDLAPSGDTTAAYNAEFVATAPGSLLAGVEVAAYVSDGPTRWGGPYGRRPEFFASPIISEGGLPNIAKTRLARAQRRQATLQATVVTDDRIQVGDVIRIVQGTTTTDCIGRVTATQNGVTPNDDPTLLTVSVLSGTVTGQPVTRGAIVTGQPPAGSGTSRAALSPSTVSSSVLRADGSWRTYSSNNLYQGPSPAGGDGAAKVRGWAQFANIMPVAGQITSARIRIQALGTTDVLTNPSSFGIVLWQIGKVSNVPWPTAIEDSFDGPQLVNNEATEVAIPISWISQLVNQPTTRAIGIYSDDAASLAGLNGPSFQLIIDSEA